MIAGRRHARLRGLLTMELVPGSPLRKKIEGSDSTKTPRSSQGVLSLSHPSQERGLFPFGETSDAPSGHQQFVLGIMFTSHRP